MIKANNDKEVVEIVNKLDWQIDRLAHLIADLLDITRIGEGQLLLHPEVFDINMLIHEMAELMQRTSPKHVIVHELQSLPPVRSRPERIGQVLINLLGNAIKYSPNGQRIISSFRTGE